MKSKQEMELEELAQKYELRLSLLKDQNDLLKDDLEVLKARLKEYQEKDNQIKDAYVVAVETAKELEKNSALVYELEIKRIRLLYTKFDAILQQIKHVYPIENTSALNVAVADFQNSINSILNKGKDIQNETNGDKIYAKNLLSRMWGKDKLDNIPNLTTKPQTADTPTTKIARKNGNTQIIQKLMEQENKRLNIIPTKDETFAPVGEGEFLKFLNSEFDDFDYFQGKEPDGKRKAKTVLDLGDYSETNESGFNLKEAVTPTEDLDEIMKIFNVNDDKEGK